MKLKLICKIKFFISQAKVLLLTRFRSCKGNADRTTDRAVFLIHSVEVIFIPPLFL